MVDISEIIMFFLPAHVFLAAARACFFVFGPGRPAFSLVSAHVFKTLPFIVFLSLARAYIFVFGPGRPAFSLVSAHIF